MTQAPTPGPLSEDDVNRECKACGAFKPDRDAVCTFCGLAPTAPVEASGSEREHGPKCWGKTSISDEMMYCYCGSTDSPPGETREALDRLKMAAHVYEDDEMAADCETLEALLSTRPLALGGQQGEEMFGVSGAADEVEALACAIWAHRCPGLIMDEDDDRPHYMDAARAAFTALEDTTPARAEAQDEGVAGEPVAWRETFIVEEEGGAAVGIVIDMPDGSQIWTGECSTQLLEDARAREESPQSSGQYLIVAAKGEPTRVIAQVATVDDGIALARAIAGPAPAHPSPTPAADADADRVREKAAFVQGYEDGYSDCSAGHDPDAEPNWTSHLEALAALKSEGGK